MSKMNGREDNTAAVQKANVSSGIYHPELFMLEICSFILALA